MQGQGWPSRPFGGSFGLALVPPSPRSQSHCFPQEEQFAKEFLDRDGLYELIGVINVTHGNVLAVCPLYPLITAKRLIHF